LIRRKERCRNESVLIYGNESSRHSVIVRDGYYYAFAAFIVAATMYFFTGSWLVAVVPLLPGAFFLWFFRNPQREIPQAPGLVVSPADGKVTEVTEMFTPDGLRIRVSIFLSVFDVHVNRAPIAGVLRSVQYQRGQFLNAMNPESAHRNEQNIAIIEGPDGTSVTFKMIAGLLARRIVFRPKEGQQLRRGELVGMIKFGSRCDVLLPANALTIVKKGQKVLGGATVLAVLR